MKKRTGKQRKAKEREERKGKQINQMKSFLKKIVKRIIN